MTRTKPTWGTLQGIAQWMPELEALLKDAKEAATGQDDTRRLACCEYLLGFILASRPQDADMDALDAQAKSTADALMDATIGTRMAAIASRTADYVLLQKRINAAAENAEKAAASIRLSKIGDFVDATTRAIDSTKGLIASLDAKDPKVKVVLEEIQNTANALASLRDKVAALG